MYTYLVHTYTYWEGTIKDFSKGGTQEGGHLQRGDKHLLRAMVSG